MNRLSVTLHRLLSRRIQTGSAGSRRGADLHDGIGAEDPDCRGWQHGQIQLQRHAALQNSGICTHIFWNFIPAETRGLDLKSGTPNAPWKICQDPTSIVWARENGLLPVGRSTDDGQGLLVITSVRSEDSGTYICTATIGRYVKTETAILNVGGELLVLIFVSFLVRTSQSVFFIFTFVHVNRFFRILVCQSTFWN